jgi:hypothetical protein
VESKFGATFAMLSVPQFDFTTMSFSAPLTAYGVNMYPDSVPLSQWAFNGPSQPLQLVALGVMGRGDILPIAFPGVNASWSQDFWGPALQCNHVSGSLRDDIWVNIWNSYRETYDSNLGAYGYLSWVPWNYDDAVRYLGQSVNSSRDHPFLYSPSEGQSGPPSSLVSGYGPSSLWIAAIPGVAGLSINQDTLMKTTYFTWLGGDTYTYRPVQNRTESFSPAFQKRQTGNTTFSPALLFETSTLLRCDLLNTSYSVALSYPEGAQTIHVSSNRTGDAHGVNGSDLFTSLTVLSDPGVPTPDGCSPFFAYGIPDNDLDPDNLAAAEGPPCSFHLDSLRLLAYQSISAAFNQLILGSVRTASTNEGAPPVVSTEITKTILGQTEELGFLRNTEALVGNDYYFGLQDLLLQSSAQEFAGLVNPVLPTADADLKSTLEVLFQNFTMSLLTDQYFWYGRFASRSTND